MRWILLLSLSAAITLAAGKVSTNARCGNAYNALPGGMTCKGSKWGDCCSQYGYCGKTKDYCGTGCQSSFGTCNGVVAPARTSTTSSRLSTSTSTRTASSTAPSATGAKVKVTTNARCGNSYGASPAGMTCSGGKYGDCCSQYSYCGSGSAYCGTGCQAGFGKCDAVVSSARSSASSSSTSSPSSSSSASSSSSTLLSTSTGESTTSTASSSSTSSSISASSSSPAALSTSASEAITSTSSSSTSTDETSTPSSSSSSSEISVTPETATSTITSTPVPTPSTAEFCGTKGYIKEQPSTFTSSPFTTTEDCLANCRAESRCGSVIISASGCYLNESPITSANVDLGPGSPLTFYNRECGISASVTTTLPVTPATSTTSSSTTSVSPTATELCGVEGIDNINLQVIKASPFTTNEDCLSNCRAESECGSFIIYSNTCYLARIPITATNVDPRPGSGLTYYNRDCGTSAPAATMPPTTLATSTFTSTSTPTPTPTPSVCVPAAPTVSCVKYPNCPQFTTPLSNACSANNSQCKDNYFVRCGNIPAAGSQVILALGGIPDADVCRQRCDALNNCSAFAFKSSSCILYSTINGFISDPATTFIRICADSCAGQPVKRGEEEKGSDKPVSIAKWTQGKQGRQRGPKDT